jgi:hypothetical protein
MTIFQSKWTVHPRFQDLQSKMTNFFDILGFLEDLIFVVSVFPSSFFNLMNQLALVCSIRTTISLLGLILPTFSFASFAPEDLQFTYWRTAQHRAFSVKVEHMF